MTKQQRIASMKLGSIFGSWTVVKRVANNIHNQVMWECRCECGKIVSIVGSSLRSGHSRSCGCKKALPSGEAAFNSLYRNYEFGAKRRGRKFNIPRELFRELTKQNCFYCGTPPSQILQYEYL